eukprot:Blabericola_migrator_1__4062@NODE_2239_length_3070_cov_133_593407_g464_i1_p1_GENE_NODE_2239_length_3070_cov_133_593407_g464_i1NODE_2239_length_3070_cov_133_593407_g464_i1_p1_ORF_typecomplete_len277_score41_51OTU/PF02338_19/4_8e03OTU/PF02338_19/2_5e21Peptidase_C65/PF10275_9/7_6e02Peptidase_C65/PF10275_9/7_2e06GGACT/PF06094_12/0_0035GGACT/PF06094_12/2_3e03DUF2911/PF11138_8/0_5DUF2911/PF11138_8/1_3e02ResB/PF05140_14/0_15_NODE_2239_length_3070_cov_133_593407_g464_i117682598
MVQVQRKKSTPMTAAAERRKMLVALRAEMNKALAAESDRRKRKQLQKEYEARIAAVTATQETVEGDVQEVDTTAAKRADDVEPFTYKVREIKVNKAQLRREKKEKERFEQHAQLIAENKATDKSEPERLAMQRRLDREGLTTFQIASDGNCLFRAIEHQLSLFTAEEKDALGIPKATGFRDLRRIAAHRFQTHPDEYSFFLDESDDGSVQHYINQLKDSDEWGGELEIRLLSDALNIPIDVYTADEKISYNESADVNSLKIAFYKHMMASGKIILR